MRQMRCAKSYLRMTKYLGKRWIVNVFVHFRLILHFEQVGISSPSITSSLINRSRQLSNLHRLDVGSGTLRSQNGSNVSLAVPHTVHFNELFNWPTNKSLITEFSTFEYHSHVRSAFRLVGKLSSITNFSPVVPAFSATCNASKKKRRNSCASCCEQPLYMRCLLEKADFSSLGVTLRVVPLHMSLMSFANSVTIRESFVETDRTSTFVFK